MKRFFTQLLVCALVISLFAACAASTPNDATSENPAGTTGTTSTTDAAETGFTVTDVEGNEIYFEKQPETFVVANYIFNFLLIGGKDSLSKVVGLTKDGWEDTRYGEYQALTEAYPELLDIKSIGGYHDDVLDRELILELKPDCLLINKSQYTENETVSPFGRRRESRSLFSTITR